MIARLLGKTVAEINDEMSPGEYFLWESFIRRHVPLELEVKRLQHIQAETWAILSSFVSGFTKNPVTHFPHEVAPWLTVKQTGDKPVETEKQKRTRRLALARRLRGL